MTKHKVGDWVYSEFTLKQVQRIENGLVYDLSDGHFCCCGRHDDADLMPVTMDIKCISGEFEAVAAKLHREGNGGLNYPAIRNWMDAHWLNTCRASLRHDEKTVAAEYALLNEFQHDILRKSEIESGYGFPLFRSR
jgi:hypothetical protein